MLRPFAHPVACCWMLLRRVWTGQIFQPTTPNISFVPWSPKRSATMLDPFAQLFQHCWGRARSLRMVYKDLWVVSFPRCTAGPNIVASCCIRLQTTANTHATTPNIVCATMLGCRSPKPTIWPKWEVGVNVSLREGVGWQFPRNQNWSDFIYWPLASKQQRKSR